MIQLYRCQMTLCNRFQKEEKPRLWKRDLIRYSLLLCVYFLWRKKTPVSIKRDPADTKDTIKTKSARIMNVFFIFYSFFDISCTLTQNLLDKKPIYYICPNFLYFRISHNKRSHTLCIVLHNRLGDIILIASVSTGIILWSQACYKAYSL